MTIEIPEWLVLAVFYGISGLLAVFVVLFLAVGSQHLCKMMLKGSEIWAAVVVWSTVRYLRKRADKATYYSLRWIAAYLEESNPDLREKVAKEFNNPVPKEIAEREFKKDY